MTATLSTTFGEALLSSFCGEHPDLVRPRFFSCPEFDRERTLGPEVAAVATLAGFPPDPEQRLLLDCAFALDGRGKSVAFELVVIAPRQNLKTGFFKQYALGQTFVRDEPLVVWSSHEFPTAQEALRDVEALIDGSRMLTRRVKRILHGSSPEIELLSGGRLIFKTRTSGGGRGLSGRKVVLDEGYALQAGQVGALMPIMLAQPDPQVCIGSSACRPESAVLWDRVQLGRKGGADRMMYAEWCAPDPAEACRDGDACDHGRDRTGCGCDRPELIRDVHSAVTRGRIALQTVVDLRRTMPPAEFGREVMGWHDEPVLMVPPLPGFSDCLDERAAPADPVVFGVDCPPDMTSATVMVCGDHGGVPAIEMVVQQRGTRWLSGWLTERVGRYRPLVVAVMGNGPAGALTPELEKIDGLELVELDGADEAQACTHLTGAVADGLVRFRPDDRLTSAVEGAVKRTAGDGFRWSRANSDVNIAPLVAATACLWARHTRTERKFFVY